jgi:hypothetical protein
MGLQTGLVAGSAAIVFGVVALVYGSSTHEKVGGGLILAGGAVFFVFSLYGIFYWRRHK